MQKVLVETESRQVGGKSLLGGKGLLGGKDHVMNYKIQRARSKNQGRKRLSLN